MLFPLLFFLKDVNFKNICNAHFFSVSLPHETKSASSNLQLFQLSSSDLHLLHYLQLIRIGNNTIQLLGDNSSVH